MNYDLIVHALVEQGVDFVIIGGWAGILHGSALPTEDIDFFYSRTSENLSRIVKAPAPFHPRPRGFPPDLPFLWDVATLRNGTLFTLVTDAGAVALLSEVVGLGSYEEVKDKAVLKKVFDRDALILDLPSLIAAKTAAGRQKDFQRLAELQSLLDAQKEDT